MGRIVRTYESKLGRAAVWASRVIVLCLLSTVLNAQTSVPAAETERPVPILTGNAGFSTNVNGGETELVPSITPVLLVPLGDRWLVESRAEFTGEFERPDGGGSYGGKVEQEIDYLQLDYIANRYLTVTGGRFLTPFGIYNERLYPIWIRSLQPTPLIFPLGTGSSDGGMLRGGFSLNPKVNLNYATYFSTLSTVNKFESGRTAGGRLGFFLPGARIEVALPFRRSCKTSGPMPLDFILPGSLPRFPSICVPSTRGRMMAAATGSRPPTA